MLQGKICLLTYTIIYYYRYDISTILYCTDTLFNIINIKIVLLCRKAKKKYPSSITNKGENIELEDEVEVDDECMIEEVPQGT